MKGFDPETFGELYADEYDATDAVGMEEETRASVAVLAALANGGRVLELAVGTGRVALLLAATGLEVHGIEASKEMVAKLREKPGGDAIPVTIGDMADVDVEGTFDLVYLVFNTIFNLTSQEAQVRLFKNVAQHLTARGVFVVETYIPDFKDFVDNRAVRGRSVTKEGAGLEIIAHDPTQQTLSFQRLHFTEAGTQVAPLAMRYAWPMELDLMARLAGLALRERWGGWDISPFTGKSTSHVSVWGRP